MLRTRAAGSRIFNLFHFLANPPPPSYKRPGSRRWLCTLRPHSMSNPGGSKDNWLERLMDKARRRRDKEKDEPDPFAPTKRDVTILVYPCRPRKE